MAKFDDAINEVFEYWKLVFDHKRARLDQKRRTKLRLRLTDGYTVEDLKLAVDGCRASPFHLGQNDRQQAYDDIELICRDAPHIDKFIKLGEQIRGKKIEEQRGRDERQQHTERVRSKPPAEFSALVKRIKRESQSG